MPLALSPLQQQLVAEMGNLYESYGLPRIKGLVIGLLMTQPEAVSLDDLSELLSRSKGALSAAVRELAAIGLIRKVDGPVTRRDYYVLDPDVFFNNFQFNMATVRKNRQTAERFLAQMAGTDDANAVTLAHLQRMQAFYSLMETFYADFARQWEAVQQQEVG